MRYYRRRRRSRAAWGWADTGSVTKAGSTTQAVSMGFWLLPPGRVSWLLENQLRRDALIVKRILAYIYYTWNNTSEVTQFLPVTQLYVIKDDVDAAQDTTTVFEPFFSPPVPSAITAWNTGDQDADGVDPFLWTGHLTSPDAQIAAGGTLTYPQWAPQPGPGGFGNMGSEAGYGVNSPTHDIRVKRRLTKAEGIWFGANIAIAPSAALELEISYNVRVVLG